ncbi:hypothetical protein GCM10029964_005760 [Kibdelosporangium lantanae]
MAAGALLLELLELELELEVVELVDEELESDFDSDFVDAEEVLLGSEFLLDERLSVR